MEPHTFSNAGTGYKKSESSATNAYYANAGQKTRKVSYRVVYVSGDGSEQHELAV